MEIPDKYTNEEILTALNNYDYFSYNVEKYQNFTNNAILNPILSSDTDKWLIFKSNSYSNSSTHTLATGNYWGTENKTLINKMIIDADDYAGTY